MSPPSQDKTQQVASGAPCNCAAFTMEELEQFTGGRWLRLPGALREARLVGVVDHSTACRPGMLFVAIHGERTDGHAFLCSALAAGVSAVCIRAGFVLPSEVRTAAEKRDAGILAVPDTLKAFHELARRHRLRFPGVHVVAVTGSNGKTSVKEMIAGILEQRWPGAVLKTLGNTNNHFGTPRNLLRLGPHHRAAVVELGSNHPGEIAALARLVSPGIGVISSIGPAHLEFFGDLEGVAREKGALFESLPTDGCAVFPFDAPCATVLERLAGSRLRRTFAVRSASTHRIDVCARYLGLLPGETRFGVELAWSRPRRVHRLVWTLCGEHQAANAAAATAVADALAVPPSQILAGLRNCRLPGMRMEVSEIAGVHWVNDAYNGNPESLQAGLRCFMELAGTAASRARWLVLGDMLELGPTEEAAHEAALDRVLRQCGGCRVLVVGPRMSAAASGLRAVCPFPDAGAAREYLLPRLEPGAWVFLKGSRGMHLETVLPVPDQA
ncbi:MAG: UDP-N-acetylmuramoyl-tripeptide--D-alanyl-D-alanine ligase [Kiritimatiellaeota bacterium]|nr:UDP-N-acetylmuramoyl-tripeptide--D-alanyl-D-alanine ligase [Kiritimatiellota bacterium]